MLPLTVPPAGAPAKQRGGKFRTSVLGLYLRRLLKPSQMDFQYCFWTMVQLVASPKTAFRHASYHKQTKNHWARDDPAFAVALCGLVAAAAAAYCLAFEHGLGRSLLTILWAVGAEFLGAGALIATAGWAGANKYLRRKNQHQHAVEQSVEWMYAWDVHCNAFFPFFLLLYVLQLALCPVLLMDALFARALSAALYVAGAAYYCYISFLGYSALPFLERTELLLYPVAAAAAAALVAVAAGANCTHLVLHHYFPYSA